MGNFRQNSRSGGKGRSRDFGGRNSGRPTMHSAVCSDCGKDCEVPFKPTGDKPIFCNDCFKGNAEPRRFNGRNSGRFNSGEKRMHEAVCDKCGKNCELPFKPTGNKPVFCSDCFGHVDKGKGNNQESKQFEVINTKLDKILKALGLTVSVEVDEKKKVDRKTIIVKPGKIAESKAKKVLPKKTVAKKAVVKKVIKSKSKKVISKKAKVKKKK